MNIGVVVSEFNSPITEKLLEEAERGLKEEGADYDVEKVPGAFEIPLIAQKMAKSEKYDAVIVLGCVIKGETDHYEMVCRACVDGLREVMMKYETPVVFEVLMVHDPELARARTHKGYTAVQVALEMAKKLS